MLSVIFITGAWAQPAKPIHVKGRGETVITARSGKSAVAVKIGTHEVDIGRPSDERPEILRSACTYSRYPCSVVDYIDITVNEKSIFVPRSVYLDRGDINDAKVTRMKNAWLLTLRGGDASESYFVEVIFDSVRVRSRAVLVRPHRALEVTKYYEVVVN